MATLATELGDALDDALDDALADRLMDRLAEEGLALQEVVRRTLQDWAIGQEAAGRPFSETEIDAVTAKAGAMTAHDLASHVLVLAPVGAAALKPRQAKHA